MKQSRGTVFRRQQKLIKKLQDEGEIFVEDVAKELGVSEITIRRDLQLFDDRHLIERFYGGARYIKGTIQTEKVKDKIQTTNKQIIAKKAAELVNDYDMVFINSGSTAFSLLKYLAHKKVTILTNNGRAIFKRNNTEAVIIVSGGEIYERKKSLVGDFAINSFSRVTANICFLGVGGLSKEGITTYALPETAVNKMILERTEGPRIVVCEGEKIGRKSNFFTADCSMITHVITDTMANRATVEYLKDLGIDVIFVDEEE
ncbi:DeoR/GlpR family DNA-binding transcription regulator [Granulicatella balaenopterae]|nr:DeoR/GlpR family DNA-binding transcription regulator [Granulicatella balaenopterae]